MKFGPAATFILKLLGNTCEILIPTWCTNPIVIKNLMSPDGFAGGGINHRSHYLVKCLVGIALQHYFLIAVDEAAAKTPVNRGFVKDQSILNVIATVAHNSHSGILASWDLVKLNQVNCL